MTVRELCVVRWCLLGLGLGLSWPAGAQGARQTVEVVDLAQGNLTKDVTPGNTFRVLVRNLAPGRKYSQEIRHVLNEIPPLTLLATQAAPAHDPCARLQKAVGDLGSDQLVENGVPAAMRAVQEALKELVCSDKELRDDAQTLLARTELDLGAVTVVRGEKVVVTIGRTDASWTATFDGGKRGEWQGSYGFLFGPGGDEHYFSSPVPDGKFQVTKEEDRGGLAFTPMAFYSWLPAGKANSDVALAVTGGLGFESERPAVTLGLSAVFNRNLSIVGGVLMRSVDTLSGKYPQDALPVVAENLTADQLQTHTYRPTWFVGVSFRFSESPFAKSSEGGGEGKQQPDKPKGGEGTKAPEKPKDGGK